ncbi:MAG: class I SAM-dependent methyltransferase [Gemmatimonadetes bacterium]|nr:class I SAM-dependent methyltransferase [Gemmatimonadota bacterium]
MTEDAPAGHRPRFPDVGNPAQFEERYRAHQDPWRYAERAVEVLRHEVIAETANACHPRRILEIGCALGQITLRLRSQEVTCGIDVSPTAASRAHQASHHASGAVFAAASVLTLPFADRTFDVVIASDGPWGWGLSDAERADALREIERVLVPDGRAILTEHLRPSRFVEFVNYVTTSGLQVERVAYLGDRPSYQLESLLKRVKGSWPARALLGSRSLARLLRALARPLGASASRHILVVAGRRPT